MRAHHTSQPNPHGGTASTFRVSPKDLAALADAGARVARSTTPYLDNSREALAAAAAAVGDAGLEAALVNFMRAWDPSMVSLAQRTAALAQDLGSAANAYSQADLRSAARVAQGGGR